MEQQKGSTSKEMIWALRWSVALRTFYRQILSLLYSSFPFGNFRPRLVRALLVFQMFVGFFSASQIAVKSHQRRTLLKAWSSGTR